MKKILFFLVMILILSSETVGAVSEEDVPPLFYLVAGSFQELENAQKHQEELYNYRYYSRIMGYPIDGTLYWRVVIAQDKEKENLEEMKTLLKEDGFETFFAYDSGEGPERPYSPDPIPVPEPEVKSETRQFILDLIAWLYLQLERY
jgi:hypothetical protein